MLELLKEKIELIDPLMIFPSHRKLKHEWEQQNIKLDIQKLRKHKQSKKEIKK